MEIADRRKAFPAASKISNKVKNYTALSLSHGRPHISCNSLNPQQISDFLLSGRRFATELEQFVFKEEKHMRRISGFLAPLSLALILIASAITGCSASGRVRINNPDHDANHFTNTGGHDRQQYAPHNGGNYQTPAYK